jgi:hypothetical protein
MRYVQGPLYDGGDACFINETIKSNKIGHSSSTSNVTYEKKIFKNNLKKSLVAEV